MLSTVALAFALAQAPAGAETPASPPIVEVAFAPLKRSEARYAKLGPAGPYYPQVAANARANGEAILDCEAKEGGILAKCRMISETPWGSGFAPAARIMAERGRILAVTSAPIGQRVLVRVPFVRGAPTAIAP
jgi:hypothetical protein